MGLQPNSLDRCFFSLLDDLGGRNLSAIPSSDCVNNISGNSFFIRSKVSRYCPVLFNSNATNSVYVSRTKRARFRVSVSDKSTAETIMIGSDEIIITLHTVDLVTFCTKVFGHRLEF